MFTIKKIAVIGAGLMGSGIAAHIAANNIPVLLLDIVIDKSDMNSVAKNAIKHMKRTNTSIITPGNLENDLEKLKDIDWIIEVIKEDVEVKRNLYKKMESFIKKDAIISSNTSTISRKDLIKEMSNELADRFFITHFFNPPQHMRLLEVVKEKNQHKNVDVVEKLCDEILGKTIIHSNDSPGFIGNRVGCFWLLAALTEIHNFNITPESVDSFMSHRLIGIPETGIFGLLDLIGLDTFVLICESLVITLHPADDFVVAYQSIPKIVKNMINDGFVGVKTKAGFYKNIASANSEIRQSIDLTTGLYKNVSQTDVIYAKNLSELISLDNSVAQYSKKVWIRTLSYAASLIPEVTDNICLIDEVMRLGFNWINGPFEMIDLLDNKTINGARWIKQNLHKGKAPGIINHEKEMYLPGRYLNANGKYEERKINEESWYLYDKKHMRSPVICNNSAKLWDIGDDVACFEITSKNNCFDYSVLKLLSDSLEIVKQSFKCMIIGHDGNNFSVGANLRLFFRKSPEYVQYIINYGQQTFRKLKFSPFPVVGAISGFTVGGGCEISLHCDGLVAHLNTAMGLVEANIGVIPGWGGCKEMLLRYNNHDTTKLFNQIFTAKLSTSAADLQEMKILRDKDKIVRNKKRLLPEAKKMALEMHKNYKQPITNTIKIKNFEYKEEGFTVHDKVIAKTLYDIIIQANNKLEDDVLQLEQEAFVYLIKHPDTQARIKHMFYNKSKLHN